MNLPNGHFLQNGKYKITHVVGQGGFGITYKGVWYTEVKGSLGTVKTEVPIAIKEYFFKDYCYREKGSYSVKIQSETGNNLFHKFKEKLIKEARILSDVHHPHIVNVLEVFEENNTAYIAMEYISGLSLKQMMEKDGALSEGKALKYIHQIGEALQFVHENNILHLDIKPSNILIDRNDNARLIDFGVSKRYDEEQQETSTTMLTLSKGFAAIEQYDNEGTQNFSPYPDIYSLGATMYNLLTGKTPTESILRATRPLINPRDLNPLLSGKTQETILKAMQIVPSDRYASVKAMMKELDQPPRDLDVAPGHTESESFPGGDTTILFSSNNSSSLKDNPEEETVLNLADEKNTEKAHEEKKDTSVLSFWIITGIIASAIAIILFTYKPDEIHSEGKQPESEVVFPVEPAEELLTQTDEPVTIGEENKKEDIQETILPEETETEGTETSSTRNNDNMQEVPETNQVYQAETDATYNDLITSGKKRMDAGDYRGAMEKFIEANSTKGTTEAANLINEAQIKAEEKQIAERKTLYEEQMTIGNMIVVKKISTGLYGAIDDKGYEVILCKYLGADRTENGRAFEREDGLFDIYNNNGRLVEEGVTSY